MTNDPSLSPEQRRQIARLLAELLADTHATYLKTHGYHWNVEGAQFAALHALFEEQYTELWGALDVIAERIRALGFYAPASLSDFNSLSNIEEDRGVPTAREMVRRLAEANDAVVARIRAMRPAIDEAADNATASLLDERLSTHEKAVWMLKSISFEPPAGATVTDAVLKQFDPAS